MLATENLMRWSQRLSQRQWFLLGFLICFAMELSALYFQFVAGLEPCPLCITQRLIVAAAAMVFLTGMLHNPGRSGMRIYAGVAALVALLGMSVAVYHFVIQLLPKAELADCGPGASYILEHMALSDAIRMFLTGTGDCAQVVWSLFGLSMPFWVALCFAALAGLSLLQFVLTKEPTPPRTP